MLSLILPTYNEAASISSLIDYIDGVLQSVPHEIIIVDDDSPDGTWKVAEGLMAKHPALRVIRRTSTRGLSSAVIEGFRAAGGDILAVMDADGQHDAILLHKMLASIHAGAEISIGSRYVAGGSVGEWVTDRRIISSAGTLVAKALSRVRVSDPLGGFFALRADLYKSIRSSLRPSGFKILLEILAHIPVDTSVTEIPLIFRMRLHGHSKLSIKVYCQFVWQAFRLMIHRCCSCICLLSRLVFCIACVALFIVMIPHVWSIRLLYTDRGIRALAKQALIDTAAKEGWLLSDMEVTHVGTDSLTILHREHMRFPPASEECILHYRPYSLTCEKIQL